MRSVMSHQFSQVPRAEIQRSTFDRSHGYKTTFDAGYLIPVLVDEVLPGDTFNLRATFFGRLATPIKPIMDNLFLESFFFFVPNRLVWNNWEHFNGALDDPGDLGTDYTIPTVSGQPSTGTLWDYFGIPTDSPNAISWNALPSRAYNLIYNEWFRDQNLQDSVVVDKDDGPDTLGDYVLLRRGKRHDYFTSCLPWPQKGTAVEAAFTGTASVQTATATGNEVSVLDTGTTTWRPLWQDAANVTFRNATGAEANELFVDFSQSGVGIGINTLRQAFQIQKLLERDARGGTRYTEIVRAHFGVISPDARLQRPEYLGGGSTPVNISPVAQTTATPATPTSTDAQGNLAAFGTVHAGGHGFVKSFTEHGYIIGLVSVRADLTYQEGFDRMWKRSTRYDFYWPALAHIGEQAVLTQEIFADGTATDLTVFGYQERYAEYRYKPSKITGLFRSSATGSIDIWHLSQEFGTAPSLNAAFIVDNPPIDRVIAVDTEPHFLLDCFFNMKCARPMPVYGVPGFIDHF